MSDPIAPDDPRVQRKMHPFHRTELLLGRDDYNKLAASSFCVIGLGGVGSWAAEALVRSGAGHVTLVDFDEVCITNLNRQLHATRETVGRFKADVMGERMRTIVPKGDIRTIAKFYSPDTAAEILDREYAVVLDCIDNMTAKLHLLTTCHHRGQRVIASMGAGGRTDPSCLRTGDLCETRNDPFAALVRDGLRNRGIDTSQPTGIECVWSDERPADLDPFVAAGFKCICPNKSWNEVHGCESRFQVQGSAPWIPAMFGFMMAGTAVSRALGRPVWDADRDKSDRRMKPVVGKLSKARKKELIAAASAGKSA